MLSIASRQSKALFQLSHQLPGPTLVRCMASCSSMSPPDWTRANRPEHSHVPTIIGKRRLASSSAVSLHKEQEEHVPDPVPTSTLSTNKSPTRKPSMAPNNPLPHFEDAQLAYQSKSTHNLVRAWLSFGLCRIPPLVRHSESLLRLSRRVLGNTITDRLLQATLFGHFCAGQDEVTIQPTIQALAQAGIGSILDYAAEDDGSHSVVTTTTTTTTTQPSSSSTHKGVDTGIIHKARVYDYESEAMCDRHVSVFQKCIQDVEHLQADGYAAVKVTALGNPKLLERMSRAIREAQRLFAKFDVNNDGVITREEFARGYHLFFKEDTAKLNDMMEQLVDSNDHVDYISWSMLLAPRDLPSITSGCRQVGPLAMATPTEEEVELIEAMFARGRTLAMEAQQSGTRLLIDAEQARFQPAIDNLVLDLQRTFNARDAVPFPVIYNTYQCYLKDVPTRLHTDVERSERFQYHFGAKLVRGAYMESERAWAKSLGYPSPIHETIQDTHACYNDSVQFLLSKAATSDQKLELMLASHNQESIEKAIHVMNEYGIDRHDSTICFAQLFGMKDHLTYQLGQNGYRAYKYVPYGEVKMVMPYLIRRANENSSVASGAGQEMTMIRQELMRRLVGRA
jgi:proline dehydrogenase